MKNELDIEKILSSISICPNAVAKEEAYNRMIKRSNQMEEKDKAENNETELEDYQLAKVAGGEFTQNRWDPNVCNKITTVDGRCRGAGDFFTRSCDHYRDEQENLFIKEYKYACVMGRYKFIGDEYFQYIRAK